MQLVIHPDAQSEIVEAADWYDQRATTLGDDFLAEVNAALRVVSERPRLWPTWPETDIQPPAQRYLLARFRFYAIAFQAWSDHVLVLAVVHLRRRPFYWLERATH